MKAEPGPTAAAGGAGRGRRAAQLVSPWTQVRAAGPVRAPGGPGSRGRRGRPRPGPRGWSALGRLSLAPGTEGPGGRCGEFGHLGRSPLRRRGAALGATPGRAAGARQWRCGGHVPLPLPHPVLPLMTVHRAKVVNGLGCSPWSGEGVHPGKGGRDRAREGERAGKRWQETPQTDSGTERRGGGGGRAG